MDAKHYTAILKRTTDAFPITDVYEGISHKFLYGMPIIPHWFRDCEEYLEKATISRNGDYIDICGYMEMLTMSDKVHEDVFAIAIDQMSFWIFYLDSKEAHYYVNRRGNWDVTFMEAYVTRGEGFYTWQPPYKGIRLHSLETLLNVDEKLLVQKDFYNGIFTDSTEIEPVKKDLLDYAECAIRVCPGYNIFGELISNQKISLPYTDGCYLSIPKALGEIITEYYRVAEYGPTLHTRASMNYMLYCRTKQEGDYKIPPVFLVLTKEYEWLLCRHLNRAEFIVGMLAPFQLVSRLGKSVFRDKNDNEITDLRKYFHFLPEAAGASIGPLSFIIDLQVNNENTCMYGFGWDRHRAFSWFKHDYSNNPQLQKLYADYFNGNTTSYPIIKVRLPENCTFGNGHNMGERKEGIQEWY